MQKLTSLYLEVIQAAKVNQHFEDFKTAGRLSNDVAHGYQAKLAAFADLEAQHFVKLEAGSLVLNKLSPISWLTEGLLNGEPAAWQICDAYPQKAKKFEPDTLNLNQIGLDGEKFVVEFLRGQLDTSLHSLIRHVSLIDDTAGFDILTPSHIPGTNFLLEIKTTTRPSEDFTFHLSRNEWNVAMQNSNWLLILVQRIAGKFSFFGYLDSKSLVGYFPRDSHPKFQWSSTQGRLNLDDVFEGFPII